MHDNSIKQFLEKIDNDKLEKFSFYNLSVFCLLPILLFIINLFSREMNYSICLMFDYLIGFFGIINIILYFVYNKVNFKKKIFLPLLFIILYILWATISTFFSNNKFYSIFGSNLRYEGLLTYFSYFGFFCHSIIIVKSNNFYKIFKIFGIVTAVISILTLMNYYINPLDFNFERPFTSIFRNENHFAYYLMMGFVCDIMIFMFNNKKENLIYLLLSMILLHCLILNNTLGCYVSIIGILIVLLVYCLVMKKYYSKFLVILICFVSISIFNGSFVSTNFKSLFNDAITIKDSVNNDDKNALYNTGTYRMGLWLNGLKFISEKPLFGYGIENLLEQYVLCENIVINDRPHNEYIQIAAFMGIPALVFYLCFLCSIFFKIIFNLKKINEYYIIAVFISLSYLFSAFFGVSMFYTTPYLYIFIGLTVAYQFKDYQIK